MHAEQSSGRASPSAAQLPLNGFWIPSSPSTLLLSWLGGHLANIASLVRVFFLKPHMSSKSKNQTTCSNAFEALPSNVQKTEIRLHFLLRPSKDATLLLPMRGSDTHPWLAAAAPGSQHLKVTLQGWACKLPSQRLLFPLHEKMEAVAILPSGGLLFGSA